MRIIGGSLKGRPINFLKNSKTRPLKDNVKESIFNVLQHSNVIKTKIENSTVLDLYSGIGSFGIECISRGAKDVTFIDQDINATNILKENLDKLLISNRAKIFINKIDYIINNKINKKFSIFFLDPPFAEFNFLNNLKLIKQKKFFNKEHIIIIHRETKSKDNYDNLLEIIETKKYGRSKIIFGFLK